MLESNKNYGMYLQLVRDANLTELLEDPKQSLTLLVPTNDIFRELTDLYYELKAHPKQLENFIKVHILDGMFFFCGLQTLLYIGCVYLCRIVYRRLMLCGHCTIGMAICPIGEDNQWLRTEACPWSTSENPKCWRYQVWYYCRKRPYTGSKRCDKRTQTKTSGNSVVHLFGFVDCDGWTETGTQFIYIRI